MKIMRNSKLARKRCEGIKCEECSQSGCPYIYCIHIECLGCKNRHLCPMCQGNCEKCDKQEICKNVTRA